MGSLPVAVAQTRLNADQAQPNHVGTAALGCPGELARHRFLA
jgi:hypothetical protein